MDIEVLTDAAAAAHRAAGLVAAEARDAVRDRGRFVLAISGGTTPWVMLHALSLLDDVPWTRMHVVQVDERIAPGGHADRNLTHLSASLLAPLDAARGGTVQVHPMPVEADDLDEAAVGYARTLAGIAGSPPVLDLVHLGLGADGHTASLVPGDPVLEVEDADVALTGMYQGRRRMTLTFPIINRARRVLWLVTGQDKAAMLARLRRGDRTIPAGRIRQDHAIAVADLAAAGPQPPAGGLAGVNR